MGARTAVSALVRQNLSQKDRIEKQMRLLVDTGRKQLPLALFLHDTGTVCLSYRSWHPCPHLVSPNNLSHSQVLAQVCLLSPGWDPTCVG